MNTHFVYILRCCDGSFYTGLTNNIEQRIAEHNNRQGGEYTALRIPVELVFLESFPSKSEAIILERQIKGWSRKKKLALVEGNWSKISQLAKKQFLK
jgi:predicted GIY-YIG superfamily endonuclease